MKTKASVGILANGVDLILHIGPSGEQVVSNYFGNAYHQVDASYDALGQETKYLYNGNRQLIKTIRPTGLTTTNIYFSGGGSLNRLDKTIDLEIARTNSYTYAGDLVDSHTDERGLTVTNYWDGLSRLIGRRYPDGTTTSNIYTALDITATKDRMGFWSYTGYNGIRQKVAETNANGVVTRYDLCDCGSVMSVTNAWYTTAEMVTRFAYDLQGNRTNVYYPDATVTNWYDSLRRVIVTGDASGYRWFVYNNQGLQTCVSNAYGVEQLIVFDIEDRPIYVTDANGVTITNTYDDLGRLRTRTYPDTGVEHFGYTARGLVAYTNQLGYTNFFAYDEAGRKRFETNANWELIRYTNSPAGDLEALVDGKNQVTKWKYDEYGRVTNKLDQTGTEILRYQYDPNSRLTNRWSAAKGTTSYSYDAVGNLTNVDYPSGTTDISFGYDALNRVTNMVDAVGTTKYAYTAGGQLWTEDGPWANDTVTNTWNNRVRVGMDLQQPTGVWTNKFAYDAAKRLTNVTSKAGAFGYLLSDTQPSSLIHQLSLPNTSYITNAYDSMARLLYTKLNDSSHNTLDAAEYGYNAGNQREAFTNAAGTYLRFTYDKIGQLKVMRATNSAGVIVSGETKAYSYDKAWNLSQRVNNSSGSATTFSVNSKNELTAGPTSPYTYDSNGNLTGYNTYFYYTYDAENRMTSWEYSGTARTEFVYDGLGRLRVRKEFTSYPWYPAGETRYLYDGMRVIQERDDSNLPTVSYTRGTDLSGSLEGAGGIGGLLARSHNYSGGNWNTHNFYHADGNGNITYLVNSSQTVAASYRYDAYGNTISSSGSLASDNTYRFSSKMIFTTSGIYYYGYRWYDPNLQRWPNQDPLGDIGSLAVRTAGIAPWNEDDDVDEPSDDELQGAWIQVNRNLYGAIGNNPISLTDAFGLSPSLNPQNQVWACEAVETASQAAARNVARNIARESLGMGRKAANQALRRELGTAAGQAANHNIPWALRGHNLIKKAADAGWNFNARNNGTSLANKLHSGWKNWHEWHKYYNELAKRMLDRAWAKNPNMSAEEAAQAAQRIADYLGRYASRVCGQ